VAAAAKSAAKFFDATGPSASAAANPAEMTANMLVADSASAASFIAALEDEAASPRRRAMPPRPRARRGRSTSARASRWPSFLWT
jgi:hypothetical protein